MLSDSRGGLLHEEVPQMQLSMAREPISQLGSLAVRHVPSADRAIAVADSGMSLPPGVTVVWPVNSPSHLIREKPNEYTKSTKTPRVLHMWTRKERIKHFWRCCNHLTRFFAVSFAVAGTGTAFVYVGTWH